MAWPCVGHLVHTAEMCTLNVFIFDRWCADLYLKCSGWGCNGRAGAFPLPFLGSRSPKIQLGGLRSAVSSPSVVWGGAQPTNDLVHFSPKIWHLVATILIISSIVKRLLWRASPLAGGRFYSGWGQTPLPPLAPALKHLTSGQFTYLHWCSSISYITLHDLPVHTYRVNIKRTHSPVTSVDISEMHADFSMTFYTTVKRGRNFPSVWFV